MAYNLNVFEVFVVSIPRTHRMTVLVVALSVVAGTVTALTLVFSPYESGPLVPLLVAGGVFTIPTLSGGEVIHRLVPSYPRHWGLYLAFVSALLVAVLLPIAFLLGGAWNLVWLALGVAFLNNYEVLVVSDGLTRYPRLGIASAFQPAVMLSGLTLVIPGLSRSLSEHVPAVAVLIGVGLGLGIASKFVEWLMDANVTEVDGLEITSHLVQRSELDLGMGFSTEPTVQTLAVENEQGKTVIAAPWVHPGILEGIGGGRLTRETIRGLNDDGAGFFLHVPCSHLSNAAEADVPEAVLQGVRTPATSDRASPLISRTYEGTVMHGRRYGDERIVYVESTDYGDYEIGTFGEVIDPEQTLVVDRHVRADQRTREFVYCESKAAENLRGYLADFLDVLDEQPLADYRAGRALDLDIEGNGISLFALVEEVGDQRTLLLGADQNENPEPLVDLQVELDDDYDEILLFTTDTHASVYGERFDPQVSRDRVRSVVASAVDAISDAAGGITSGYGTRTRLLRNDYLRLMYSLNVTARVYILSLAALYVVLLAGMLLL